MVCSMGTSQEVTGCAINSMSEEETKEVQKTLQECTGDRKTLRDSCTTEEMEEEAVWIETRLTDVLNSYATPFKVTVHSKRWWMLEVAKKRKEYG